MRVKLSKLQKAILKPKVAEEYESGEKLKTIALRYGISIATASLWGRSSAPRKLRRGQGCTFKTYPSSADIQIRDAVAAVVDGKPTLAEIGAAWKMSRANVHRIAKKWRKWKPKPKFKDGDVIKHVKFGSMPLEVLESGPFKGTVRNLQTQEVTELEWFDQAGDAVKIGRLGNGH